MDGVDFLAVGNGIRGGLFHQEELAGGAAGPQLAGLSYQYLVEEMRRYGKAERTNSADMTNLMKAISPADREAMARYISSL